MNEKVENLVLEHRRVIRTDMGNMAYTMMTMQAEITALHHRMVGVRTPQNHDHGDIA